MNQLVLLPLILVSPCSWLVGGGAVGKWLAHLTVDQEIEGSDVSLVLKTRLFSKFTPHFLYLQYIMSLWTSRSFHGKERKFLGL